MELEMERAEEEDRGMREVWVWQRKGREKEGVQKGKGRNKV